MNCRPRLRQPGVDPHLARVDGRSAHLHEGDCPRYGRAPNPYCGSGGSPVAAAELVSSASAEPVTTEISAIQAIASALNGGPGAGAGRRHAHPAPPDLVHGGATVSDKFRSELIKLTIFFVVAVLITFSVFATLLDLKSIGFGPINVGQTQISYHAEFDNATGLEAGDTVRIAGVEVGKVNGVGLTNDNQAKVSFTARPTST